MDKADFIRFIKIIQQAIRPDDPAAPPDRGAHWQSLGRFVLTFALVEDNLQAALRICAGVTSEVARAIFSGTRVDAACSYIRRIAEAKNWSEDRKKEIDYIFRQTAEITRVRNDILHYGVSRSTDEGYTTSTELVAHMQDRIRKTSVSAEQLDAMSDDCLKIVVHLVVNFILDEATQKTVHDLGAASAVLGRAWRYKPAPQPGRRESILEFPLKPPPQPEPLRE
jgi:hypothetical protein